MRHEGQGNEETFPFLRVLLRFDTRELLNVLALAFDDHEPAQDPSAPALPSRQARSPSLSPRPLPQTHPSAVTRGWMHAYRWSSIHCCSSWSRTSRGPPAFLALSRCVRPVPGGGTLPLPPTQRCLCRPCLGRCATCSPSLPAKSPATAASPRYDASRALWPGQNTVTAWPLFPIRTVGSATSRRCAGAADAGL